MTRVFKLGLWMIPYFIFVVYLATMGPDRLQRLPHWVLWCGFCGFVGTVIATGIGLRPRRGATKSDGQRHVMKKPVAAVTIAIVIGGWVCGIVIAVIFAIIGRIPWSVPIICAPIFAFLGYGLIKAVPNIK